jgi:dienelactone hydrolase
MFYAWYPAEPKAGQKPASFEDEPLASDPFCWSSSSWLDRGPRFVSYSFLNAPLRKTQSPYPVLLYSHGAGGDNHNSAPEMAENLASHGYLVVCMDHYDAYAFTWPDGTLFKRVGDATFGAEGLADRVRDLVFLLDELPQFNQSDAILAGGFDLSRVAAAGFSWGGPTAGEFCRSDSRCRAAISLDFGGEDAPELERFGLQKPSLMLNGPDNTSQVLFSKAISDAYWTQITGMTHNDFSAWYWWNSPGSVPSRREAWRAMHACILSFLDKYLKGQNDGLLDGNPSATYPRLVNFKRK